MCRMSKDCWADFKNFKSNEFHCPKECPKSKLACYKKDVSMDCKVLRILQKTREHFGKPITITCSYRCQWYNDQLEGSVKTSKHIQYKAVDFYVEGVCDTEAGRNK